MASSITSVKGTSELKVKTYFHDPADATVATKVPAVWLPMAGFEWLLASVCVASAHAMVTFKIFAATDDSGTGATEVAAHATPTVADAAGDVLYLEASAEMVKDVLPTATHVAVEVDMDTAAALAVVSLIFGGAHRKFAGLTADQIA